VLVILLAILIEDSLFFAVWEYDLISISSSGFTSSHPNPEVAKNQSDQTAGHRKSPCFIRSHFKLILCRGSKSYLA
jgi:hypothetical protein